LIKGVALSRQATVGGRCLRSTALHHRGLAPPRLPWRPRMLFHERVSKRPGRFNARNDTDARKHRWLTQFRNQQFSIAACHSAVSVALARVTRNMPAIVAPLAPCGIPQFDSPTMCAMVDCSSSGFALATQVGFVTRPIVSPFAALFDQVNVRRRSYRAQSADAPPYAPDSEVVPAQCIPPRCAGRPQRHARSYLGRDYS
jgi:hypothetical protein